jgi:membrane-associated phospholipid phosphatase
VAGEGFLVWGLKTIYGSDVRYNCLPSLHVAQCFIAATVCHRVHRGVGRAAFVWASLVAVSTLFTKQHYLLDVIGGMALAYGACRFALRDFRGDGIPPRERELAPTLALVAVGVYGLMLVWFWLLYAAGF